jgi:hypothetical protein
VTATSGLADLDLERVERELYTDGITAMRGAHPPELVERLHEECMRLYEEASTYPGGRVRRGPQRWYYAVHPERLSMVVDLLSHPWLVQTCTHVLGPDYRIREVAFDVSFPGSRHQPWHRDFRRPVGMTTGEDGRPRITALAFNLPTVDVREELGPLEVVHGTQWDQIPTDDGMFPSKGEGQEHYEADGRRALKSPKRGDMSARTPLMLHRGTPNVSQSEERPVMVITVYAADAEEVLHGHTVLAVTQGFHDSLPPVVRDHLDCEVVEELRPIVNTHDIEGLNMGGDDDEVEGPAVAGRIDPAV